MAIFPFKKKSKVPSNLLPRVRPLWWFEAYSYNTLEMTKSTKEDFFGSGDIFYAPYDSDLGIGLCWEEGNNIHIVDNSTIKEWGKEKEDEFIKVAIQNMENKNLSFEEVSEGVWQIIFENRCTSSIMLFKEKIMELNVQGDPIIFFPYEDTVIIAGADDWAGISFCMGSMIEAKDQLLTTDTYSLSDMKWRKARLLLDNDLGFEYKRRLSDILC